jgi:Domain of unknown function (DUF1848).
MIISASRRTDIPAFYSEWFINRIREKYCTVVNPFNRNQISRISLSPGDVDVIVFWTKNGSPIIKHLDELDENGYKYYFQYTITGYSKIWEPNVPDIREGIENFIKLSERVGSTKIIWRYDPIILSNITDYNYHYNNFTKFVDLLKFHTRRVVISILDDYRGSGGRINKLRSLGVKLMDNPSSNREFGELIRGISIYAQSHGLEIYSCAEPIDLGKFGVFPGKCIDGSYIKRVFSIEVNNTKDKNQRRECGCIVSKDIGMYDTCLHMCRYCYANRGDDGVKRNLRDHMENSPSLLGWYECNKDDKVQLKLF